MLLVSDNDYPTLDAAVANHPSFLSVPDEVKAVTKPTLIQIGDSDAMMGIDQVKQSEEIFSGKSNCEVKVFPGAAHGCRSIPLCELAAAVDTVRALPSQSPFEVISPTTRRESRRKMPPRAVSNSFKSIWLKKSDARWYIPTHLTLDHREGDM